MFGPSTEQLQKLTDGLKIQTREWLDTLTEGKNCALSNFYTSYISNKVKEIDKEKEESGKK